MNVKTPELWPKILKMFFNGRWQIFSPFACNRARFLICAFDYYGCRSFLSSATIRLSLRNIQRIKISCIKMSQKAVSFLTDLNTNANLQQLWKPAIKIQNSRGKCFFYTLSIRYNCTLPHPEMVHLFFNLPVFLL